MKFSNIYSSSTNNIDNNIQDEYQYINNHELVPEEEDEDEDMRLLESVPYIEKARILNDKLKHIEDIQNLLLIDRHNVISDKNKQREQQYYDKTNEGQYTMDHECKGKGGNDGKENISEILESLYDDKMTVILNQNQDERLLQSPQQKQQYQQEDQPKELVKDEQYQKHLILQSNNQLDRINQMLEEHRKKKKKLQENINFDKENVNNPINQDNSSKYPNSIINHSKESTKDNNSIHGMDNNNNNQQVYLSKVIGTTAIGEASLNRHSITENILNKDLKSHNIRKGESTITRRFAIADQSNIPNEDVLDYNHIKLGEVNSIENKEFNQQGYSYQTLINNALNNNRIHQQQGLNSQRLFKQNEDQDNLYNSMINKNDFIKNIMAGYSSSTATFNSAFGNNNNNHYDDIHVDGLTSNELSSLSPSIAYLKAYTELSRDRLAYYQSKVNDSLETIQEEIGELRSTSTHNVDEQHHLSSQNEEESLHINTSNTNGSTISIYSKKDNIGQAYGFSKVSSPITNYFPTLEDNCVHQHTPTNTKAISIYNGLSPITQVSFSNLGFNIYDVNNNNNNTNTNTNISQSQLSNSEKYKESPDSKKNQDGQGRNDIPIAINSIKVNSPKHVFVKIQKDDMRKSESSQKNNGERKLSPGGETQIVQAQGIDEKKSVRNEKSNKALHWKIRQMKKTDEDVECVTPIKETTPIKNMNYLTKNLDFGFETRALSNRLMPNNSKNQQGTLNINTNHIQVFEETLVKTEPNQKGIISDKRELKNDKILIYNSISSSESKPNNTVITPPRKEINSFESKKIQLPFFKQNEKIFYKRKDLEGKTSHDSLNQQQQNSYIALTQNTNRGNLSEDLQNLITYESYNNSDNDNKNTKRSVISSIKALTSSQLDSSRKNTFRCMIQDKPVCNSNNVNTPKDPSLNKIFCKDKVIQPEHKRCWTEFSVYDRNTLWLNAKISKMNCLQNVQDNERIKECTFKPYFHTKSASCNIAWSPSSRNHGNGTSSSGSAVGSITKDPSNQIMLTTRDNKSKKLMNTRKSKSLCQEKKQTNSYTKLHTLKKNLDSYRCKSISRLKNIITIPGPSSSMIQTNVLDSNRSCINNNLNDKIKISEMLNRIKINNQN